MIFYEEGKEMIKKIKKNILKKNHFGGSVEKISLSPHTGKNI
jgi:hypothetical protein